MGRVGVDLYPLQVGVGLEDVETFGKFLGGSAGNVAVAAARHGRRAALITRTGPDAVRPVRAQGAARARRRRPVRHRGGRPADPGDVLRDLPAGRLPAATSTGCRPPRTCVIRPERARPRRDRATPASSGRRSPACPQEPSRSAHHAACEARGRRAADRARPGLPADVLGRSGRGRAAQVRAALPHVTVAVGNLEECEIAVGETRADAGRRGAAGRAVSSWPSSSRARRACSAMTKDERGRGAADRRSTVVNGLGAGDSFGGALCHGLLSGWDLETDPAVRQRRRRDRRLPAASAPPPCRRPTRSRRCCAEVGMPELPLRQRPARAGLISGVDQRASGTRALTDIRVHDPEAIRRAADAGPSAGLLPATTAG